jgi:hypothetical protein
MLRSWVEQYFSDLISESPLCRREEGDDVYGDDNAIHLNLETSDRLEPRSNHGPKRAEGVLRARNGRGDVIKGDVDESTFARICRWIKCQV